MNAIETLSTGNPFNIIANSDLNLDALTTGDRPNVIGNPNLPFGRSKVNKINQFFNTSAYSLPPAGTPYGNSPRDPMVGPGTVRTDMSVFKRFPIVDRLNAIFRFEAFNLFNNTNLGNPNGTFGTANFGKITSADSGRSAQIALKIEF